LVSVRGGIYSGFAFSALPFGECKHSPTGQWIEPVALAVHFENMNVVCQAVEDRAGQAEGLPDGAVDMAHLEGFQQAQNLDVFALARFTHAGFQQTPQGLELGRQLPTLQWGGLPLGDAGIAYRLTGQTH